MKDKTITFRRFWYINYLPGTMTDEEAAAKLIEQCLEKGYVPFEPQFEDFFSDPIFLRHPYRRVYTQCAYAGKKAARKIGVQKRPTVLALHPVKV